MYKELHLLKVTTKILLFESFLFLAQRLPLNGLPIWIIYLGTKNNLNDIQRFLSNRAMCTPVSAIKLSGSIFYTEITIVSPENHKNSLILLWEECRSF